MKQKTYLPGKLCDRVRDLREEWGLTRKELAERSGVDESLLGRTKTRRCRTRRYRPWQNFSPCPQIFFSA